MIEMEKIQSWRLIGTTRMIVDTINIMIHNIKDLFSKVASFEKHLKEVERIGKEKEKRISLSERTLRMRNKDCSDLHHRIERLENKLENKLEIKEETEGEKKEERTIEFRVSSGGYDVKPFLIVDGEHFTLEQVMTALTKNLYVSAGYIFNNAIERALRFEFHSDGTTGSSEVIDFPEKIIRKVLGKE
jgi:hypothetical protein